MRTKIGALAVATACAFAAVPGAGSADPPQRAFCQVTDPAGGFPDRGPTFVLELQLVETPEAIIQICRGRLSHSVDGQPVAIGNPTGNAVVFVGFECLLGVGWLQQGHPPGPNFATHDSRQVTSASGHTTLRCVFEKPLQPL